MATRFLYKIRNPVRNRAVCVIHSEKPIDLHGLLEQFRLDFGYSDNRGYFERIETLRRGLWNAREHLKLDTDPLYDELCLVFSDWCAKITKSELLFPEAIFQFEGAAVIEEFEFRL